MIWLCVVILIVALAVQNKTISELQYEVDWLQLQMALMEEEKVAQNSTESDTN
jgi:hypothetical protein